MKKFVICFFYALLILFCSTLLNADNGKTTTDKSSTSSVADETKESIVRDVKTIKEQVPKDVKKVKSELIKKSNEVKTSTSQELKEIREGFKKPLKPSTTEQKK